jgi:hypothetical protein
LKASNGPVLGRPNQVNQLSGIGWGGGYVARSREIKPTSIGAIFYVSSRKRIVSIERAIPSVALSLRISSSIQETLETRQKKRP